MAAIYSLSVIWPVLRINSSDQLAVIKAIRNNHPPLTGTISVMAANWSICTLSDAYICPVLRINSSDQLAVIKATGNNHPPLPGSTE